MLDIFMTNNPMTINYDCNDGKNTSQHKSTDIPFFLVGVINGIHCIFVLFVAVLLYASASHAQALFVLEMNAGIMRPDYVF